MKTGIQKVLLVGLVGPELKSACRLELLVHFSIENVFSFSVLG